jgi:coenzyme F420 hydrogenase subunit beta
VIHVGSAESDDVIFNYNISSTSEEILNGSKSRYYPVTLADCLKEVKAKEGACVIVGVPCFIKAVRLLMEQDPIFKKRIKFCIALFCGHLKSTEYARLLALQLNGSFSKKFSIDFRHKIRSGRSSFYQTKVALDGVEYRKNNSKLFGTDWGAGLMKLKACDYCDDIFGETADMVIGDAWLDPYTSDDKGTNILILRNRELDQLVSSAFEKGLIHLTSETAERVVASQRASLEHRSLGLSFRLWFCDFLGFWRPEKRIKASLDNLSLGFCLKHIHRLSMRWLSHRAFWLAKKINSYKIFYILMKPVVGIGKVFSFFTRLKK